MTINKSKVYLTKTREDESRQSIEAKLKGLIRDGGILSSIKEGDYVAIKITVGERENRSYIKPQYVRFIVEEVKRLGARAFLTDTNVLYHGKRQNAIDHLETAHNHGFTLENTGAPLIIADGLIGRSVREVKIDKEYIKSAKIALIALEADFILGISHLTAHMLAGFGGAIKNMGMGFANKAGKQIQHSSIKPNVKKGACTACGICVAECPVGAIEIKSKTAHVDPKTCIGCAECLIACKFDALTISWETDCAELQMRMAEYAYAAIYDKAKAKKCAFITFATNISAECDCMDGEYPIVADDVGILASEDPVAIDKASFDLVLAQKGFDPFKKKHPTTHPKKQILHAAKIGLGSAEYELVEV